MKISEAFPSNFLKAGDLQGRAVRVTMGEVILQDIGDGEKPVLHFDGKDRGLVLNKTNASMIAELYGDSTEDWVGKVIEIYPDKTSFQGRIVDCLRVRGVAPPPSEGGEEEPPF
jgi:hypothetical protein